MGTVAASNPNPPMNRLPTKSMDLQTNLSGAGLPSLLAASNISAKKKESVYMDMTIAEVDALQKEDGNGHIPTENLDKHKTVRQVLAEQKEQQQLVAANQQLRAAVAANDARNEQQASPWTASNAWNQALGPMANGNAHSMNGQMTNHGNHGNVNPQHNFNRNPHGGDHAPQPQVECFERV